MFADIPLATESNVAKPGVNVREDYTRLWLLEVMIYWKPLLKQSTTNGIDI